MIRSSFAALLGAAFGSVAIAPIRERCLDALLPNPEISAIGFTAGAAALIWLLVMACREPGPRDAEARPHALGGHQPRCAPEARPTPPTGGSGAMPARDAAGRFVKAS